MDEDTKNRIRSELLAYLNREPSPGEIMNAQADHIIMGKVRDKRDAEKEAAVQTQIIQVKAKADKVDQLDADVKTLKTKVK